MSFLQRFSFLLILLTALPLPGFAQDAATAVQPHPRLQVPGQASEPLVAPEDIPEEIIQEALKLKFNCEGYGLGATYHDCECMASKFIDARIKSDPAIPAMVVYETLKGQCVNRPEIAGLTYRSCVMARKPIDPDRYVSFCRCVANNTVDSYAALPDMNVRYIETLRRKAFIDCGAQNAPAYQVR